MAKKTYFINGVGSGYLLGSDGSLLPLMEMQDMTIDISSTMEQIYGGDGLFALSTFVKEKSASFTFTNAAFSLDMLKVGQGATVSEGGEVFGRDEITIAGGSGSLTVTSKVDVSSVIVVDEYGKPFSKVESNPAAGQFAVTTGGVLTFASQDNGKIVNVRYIYTDKDAETASILTTSVPGFVELQHISAPLEQPDGEVIEVHTRVFKARSDGKIQIDFKRGAAFAPKMTFQSLDPQRKDKGFVSIVIKKLKRN